jgi:hypothetical protein
MIDLWTLLKLIPTLLGLVKVIRKSIQDQKLQANVKDHIEKVTDAFKKSDTSALDDLFNKQ